MSGATWQVFMVICRKTLGWGKRSDEISQSQIEKSTGLHENTIRSRLKELESLGLIRKVYTGAHKGLSSCYEIVTPTQMSRSDKLTPTQMSGQPPLKRVANSHSNEGVQKKERNITKERDFLFFKRVAKDNPQMPLHERDKLLTTCIRTLYGNVDNDTRNQVEQKLFT